MELENAFKVMVQPIVTRANGDEEVHDPFPNLITDFGLAHAALGPHRGLSYYHVGKGTRPTNRGTGTVLLQWSGDTVIASEPFFEEIDGTNTREIQFYNEAVVRIVEYINPTEVRVAKEGNLNNAAAIIWDPAELHLDDWHGVTVATKNGTDAHGSEFLVGEDDASVAYLTHWRTLSFSKHTSVDPVTLTEAGWSTGSGSTSSLWGRVVFPSPIILNENDTLSMKVSVTKILRNPGRVNSDPFFGAPATWEFRSNGYPNEYYRCHPGFIYSADGRIEDYSSYLEYGTMLIDQRYLNNRVYFIDEAGTSIYTTCAASRPWTYGIYESLTPAHRPNTVFNGRKCKRIQFGSGGYNSPTVNIVYDEEQEIPDGAYVTIQLHITWKRKYPAFPIV